MQCSSAAFALDYPEMGIRPGAAGILTRAFVVRVAHGTEGSVWSSVFE